MKILLAPFLSLLATGVLCAQQLDVNNEFLVNRYALSPAFTGHNQNFESFLTFRRNWAGIERAPETLRMNLNGRFLKTSGVGADVMMSRAGIFRNLSVAASYAYHLKIARSHQVDIGLSAGVYETRVDFSGASMEALMDPMVMNNQSMRSLHFNGGFGIAYTFRQLNIGFVMPRMLSSRLQSDANGETIYRAERAFTFHASYLFEVSENFTIEPYLIATSLQNSPLFIKASALAKYKGFLWLGGGYQKGNIFCLHAGGIPYERILLQYSFESGISAIAAASAGTHEITLGFLIGKSKNENSSSFRYVNKAPYYKWVD